MSMSVSRVRGAGRRASSFRSVVLVGTALGCSLTTPAQAEKVVFNGTGDFSATRTDTLTDSSPVVDVRSTAGNLNLNFSGTNVTTGGGTGSGLFAQTGGTGTIAINSGTLNATGTGALFGIEARGQSGAISITAGSTTSNADPSSRGIQAIGNGPITIAAGTTSGGQRGIFTSAGGAVNITSTTASANGTNAPNAIVGQGTIVNITSGTASTTSNSGTSGAAIFTNSNTSTIKSTAVSLAGLNQAGIQVNAGVGTSSIDSGTITAVRSATGIRMTTAVPSSGANTAGSTVKSGTMSFNGAGSLGIDLSSNTTGAIAIESGAINANAGANNTIGIRGSVTASPAGANTATATIKSSEITLGGNGSTAIQWTSTATGPISIDSGTLRLGGFGTVGIRGESVGDATLKSGTISHLTGGTGVEWIATGNGKIALESTNSDGGSVSLQTAAGDISLKSDTVTRGSLQAQSTTGAISIVSNKIEGLTSSPMISASSQGAINVDSGSLAKTVTLTTPASANSLQGQGISVIASGTGAATVKSRSVAFTGGGNSFGIQVQAVGGGAAMIDSGSVSVVGNGGYGILGFSTSGALTINSTGNVTTSGTTRAAGGSTAPANQRYADGIDAISQSGAITVTSGGTVSTAGATARGINVEAGRAQTTFGTAVSTRSTAAISVTNSGSVTTGGANATGIRIAGDNGTVTLTSKNVSTTGANANAIAIGSGAGPISITSETATASGSGAYGIDARSALANITIAAGTTTGNNSPLSRGIHVQTDGAITITSGETNGAQRGIFTGANSGNGALPATTTINSTTATANGVSSPNAIVGQGAIVNITSGTASNTAANATGGAAIFTNSNTSTVKSTTVNLAGLNQAGIQINANTGTSSIESGTVTAAQSATGLSLLLNEAAGVGATVKSGTITLNGANSFGIDVVARAATAAFAIDSTAINAAANSTTGIRGNVAGNATIKSGTIALSGAFGTGLNWTANGAATTSIDSTTITGGAINVTAGTGATTVKSDTITRGVIGVFSTGGAVTVTSNRIEGAGSSAITAQSFADGATGAINVTSTAITGSGGGISVSGQGVVNIDSGSIVQTATLPTNSASANSLQGLGITAVGSGAGAVTVKSGSLAYTGTGNTLGIQVQAVGGGTGTINSGSVSVVGNGGYGILGYSTSGALNIASTGNVTTTGTTRSVGGSTAPANQRYADGIGALSQSGAITVASGGTVSTAGANADGIVVEAGRSITTFGTAGTVASTAAISVTNSGTVSTAGAGSTGIRVAADNNAVTLVSSNVTTSGANAAGINVTGGTGALNVTTGNVATTGATSDAVRIVSASGPITATVNGAVSSVFGNGLFIDPPSAVVINVTASGAAIGGVAGINTTGAKNSITNLGTIFNTETGAAIIATGETTLNNSGRIIGGGVLAVQFGATNDTVVLGTGSSVTGLIAGGGGTDRAVLSGSVGAQTPTQTIARFTGFDSVDVASGYWTAAPATGSAFNRATVAAGATLELANAGAGLGLSTPSITDNGTLVVRSTSAGTGSTFGSTVVTGTGNVLLTGAGTVTLDGTNSLATSGVTTIEGGTTALLTGTQGGNVVTNAGGTFQIGNGGTTGTFTGGLVDNGTLVVARSDDYTFAGALTGSGSIVKQGAGKLTFGIGYAFTGTTMIQGGSIRLSTPVSATTELAVEGSGQLDLSGTQQVVAELSGTSSQASVNVAGGSLNVNQATNSSFAGYLTGAGSLTKTGTGTLNLTGTNSYTGPTAVNGGTLAVNGSVASAVTVNAGGSLAGTGRVASATIGRAGRMTPGNSIGTLNVAGPVSFAADSIYEVEINADGRSDRVIATGPATLAGGTVTVIPEAGSFAKTTTYTILTASAVTGQFAGVTTASTVFVPVLGYTTTGVNLTVARRDLSFGAIATNANQLAVANAADALNPGNALFNAVISLPTIEAGQASFDALSGELYASVPTALLDQSRLVRGAMLERSAATGIEGIGIWGQAFDTSAEGNGRRGVAEVDADRRGIIAGADVGTETLRIGAVAGLIDGDIDVAARASSADLETKLAGVYGRVGFGGLTATVGGSYEWHDIDASRTVGTAGLAGAQTAGFDGSSRQVFGELSYALMTGEFALSPFIGVANVSSKTDGFAETGTAAALTVAGQRREATVGRFGLRIGGEAPLGASATLLPRFSIAYRQNWGDRAATSTAAFAGAPTGFTVGGIGLGRSGIDVDGGVEIGIGSAFRLGASYMMSATSDWADQGAKLTASFAF